MAACAGGPGSWSENILKYFLRNNQITAEDGAEILWSHAANHKSQMNEALKIWQQSERPCCSWTT
uniref:Family with sequence similarity 151, member B n=1 Tax=Mus musculus TaxID=10090 RepID=A0A286YD01_MOUSE